MREAPNRIVDFLTAKAKPDGDACRSNPRRRVSSKLELAWLEGKDWRTIPARLHDISRGGASLTSCFCPMTTQLVRIRIAEGDGSPWVEARILGVEPDGQNQHRIRLHFCEPCPNLLLRQAILNSIDANEPEECPQSWVAWTSTG